jgi:hypothetical protein
MSSRPQPPKRKLRASAPKQSKLRRLRREITPGPLTRQKITALVVIAVLTVGMGGFFLGFVAPSPISAPSPTSIVVLTPPPLAQSAPPVQVIGPGDVPNTTPVPTANPSASPSASPSSSLSPGPSGAGSTTTPRSSAP